MCTCPVYSGLYTSRQTRDFCSVAMCAGFEYPGISPSNVSSGCGATFCTVDRVSPHCPCLATSPALPLLCRLREQSLEANKHRLGIVQYSVSQTSLEHVLDIVTLRSGVGPAISRAGTVGWPHSP